MSDFTNVTEAESAFDSVELDEGVDFYDAGDFETIIIEGTVYGEGNYGEGPYGGSGGSVVISYPETEWTNIDTP